MQPPGADAEGMGGGGGSCGSFGVSVLTVDFLPAEGVCNHKKSRVMDFFRRVDKDQDGKITRQEFIDGILASSKSVPETG